MITRLVKLSIQEERLKDFITVFDKNKHKIVGFEGCMSLELLKDVHLNTVFTYSKWKNEDAIESYRHSELFRTVWSTVKPMFSDKPEAWSTTSLFTV